MCSDSIVRDWHGKPYYSLDSYCKNMFHHKCYKIVLSQSGRNSGHSGLYLL